MVGQTISHYKILEKLGEGGMGEVYLAEDTSLDRKVALKFLPDFLQEDPTAKKRFLREAKCAAALDHPFICKIYETGEEDGRFFISMEYVQGETLKAKLGEGQLALKETLEKATEIAEALEEAHKQGMVHRDLKPSNIMLTPQGHVKVMDFGLAKQLVPAEGMGSQEQTITASLTKTGATLGTLAYMSPEQLRGENVDTRSDIFSFGIVLYEMLTGTDPFKKPRPMETASSILQNDPPPLSRYLDEVPSLLQHTVRKMLAKEPDRRYQVIHEVRTNLEEIKEESDSDRRVSGALSPAKPKRHGVPVAIIGLGLIALGIAVALTLWLTRSPAPSQPTLTRLTRDTGLTFQPALSPNGQLVAYASDRAGEGSLDIWVQQVGGGEPIRLTRHAADDYEPAFSPDGTKIAFRSEREETGIYVVSTLGGEARLIAPEGRRPRFSPDGNWLAYWTGWPHGIARVGIHVVASGGGQPRLLHEPGRSPIWSPDGKHLLFCSPLPGFTGDWWVVSVEGGEPVETRAFEVFRRQGLSGDPAIITNPFLADIWRPEDHSIVFSARLGDSTNLWKARIAPGTWKLTDAPRRLTFGSGTERQASMAGVGRLVFANFVENKDIWVLPLDANRGKPTGEAQRVTANAADDSRPSLSADGKTMVFVSTRSGNQDVWVKDLETEKLRALTETAVDEGSPIVTADGSMVAFRGRDEVKQPTYVVPARGGVAKKVCEDCGGTDDWSNDGKRILVSLWSSQRSRYDYSLLNVQSDEVRELPLSGADPRFSPDDRWIAFHAFGSSGLRQVLIAPLRGAVTAEQSQWIAVTDGSTNDFKADWSPDGNLLYFGSDRDGFRCIYAQPLHPETKQPLGPPLEVHHFHLARRSIVPNPGEIGLSVARDKIAFTIGELTGNIWMLENVNQ